MFRKILSSRCAAALGAVFLCLAPGAALAQATYQVTTTEPTGVGSLAQAVADLNASGQPGLVSFASGAAGTINLTGGLTLAQEASLQNASGGAVIVSLSGTSNVAALTATSIGQINGGESGVLTILAQTTGDNAAGVLSAGSLSIDSLGYYGEIYVLSGQSGAFGVSAFTDLDIGALDGIISASAVDDDAFGLHANGSITIASSTQGVIAASAGGDGSAGIASGGAASIGSLTRGHISGYAGGSDASGISAVGDISLGSMTESLIIAQAILGNAYGIVSQGDVSIGTVTDSAIYAMTPGDVAYGISAVGDVTIGQMGGDVIAIASGDDAVGILGNGAVTIGTLAESSLVGVAADTGAIAVDAMNGDITITSLQGQVTASGDSGEAVGLRTAAGYDVVIGNMADTGAINAINITGDAFAVQSGGDVVLGGLNGSINAISLGSTAVGIQAQGGIHGAGGGSAAIGGTVAAEAEGIAVAVAAAGAMNLYVTGTLSGVDTSGGGQGYAIRAGVSDGAGGWIAGSADNVVTLGTGAALQGTVDLGTGENTLGLVGTGAADNLFLGVDHLTAGDGTTATSWNLSLSPVNASTFSDLAVHSLATLRINENVTITGDTVTDGSLIIDLAAGKTYAGVISGAGALVKDGDATLTLSGDSTYTGATIVASGLLDVTGSLASQAYQIYAGAGLTMAGAFTLTGDAVVNGTWTTPLLTVASGGLLMGSGTINGDVVNGGVLSPGNSPGVLSINGNLGLLSGGTLRMDLTPAGSDQLLVSGQTTLGGTLNLALAQGFYRQGQRYALISSAGGLTGGFGDVVATGSPFLYFSVDATATDVTATLGRLPYTIAATSGNAAAAARGLTGATYVATPAMQAILGQIDFMTTAEAAQGMLQMSPEPYSAFVETSFSAMRLFSDTIRERAYASRSGGQSLLAMAPGGDLSRMTELASRDIASDAPDGLTASSGRAGALGLFVKPVGQHQSFEGAKNRTGFASWQYGVVAGGDVAVNDNLLTGFQVGYVHSDLGFTDAGKSQGRSDTFLGGLYASAEAGGFYADALVQAGAAWNRLTRKIAFGGIATQPQGTYTSLLFGASLSTGYDWSVGKFKVGPVATLDYGYVDAPGFAETGDAELGLTVRGFSGNSLTSGLGAKVSGTFAAGEKTTITPELSVRWGHEFLDDSQNVKARFNGSPTSSFTAKTGEPVRDSMLVDAGVSVGVSDATKLYLRYSGQLLGQGTQSQAGAVGVRYEF
jgi:outer membrane autotransporter protein